MRPASLAAPSRAPGPSSGAPILPSDIILPPKTSWSPLRLTLGQVALIALALLAVWLLSRVLLLIFFALLLASALRGAADWLAARTKLPVGLTLAAVILGAALLLFGLFWISGPALYGQVQDLGTRLMGEANRLRDHVAGTKLMPDGANLPNIAERAVSPVATVLGFSITTITELAVALVTAIYFASAPDLYVGGLVKLVPMRRRMRAKQVIEEVGHVLRMWVLGQLADMLLVGILSALGLWLTGVPAPLALGLVSGLFTFVPYLGTIVSGALAVVIALSAGYSTALWALGVFAAVHVIEGYVIAPMIQRRILELPPALTVLSMTVLGSLFGLPGIILGTPLAAALMTLVQTLYVADVLGDPSVDPTLKEAAKHGAGKTAAA